MIWNWEKFLKKIIEIDLNFTTLNLCFEQQKVKIEYFDRVSDFFYFV